jgi:hypothetical protein
MTLKIDMGFLIDALEDHSGMASCYLDKKTGEILRISEYETEEEKQSYYEQIESDSERYVHIDPRPSHEGFRLMEDFANQLPDGEEKRTLQRALSWQKPFSNFKRALSEMPEIRDQWHKYHDERMMALAKEWLLSEGITQEEK